MIDVHQYNDYIVTPTLTQIAWYSNSARNLLIGTALQESKFFWIDQTIPGPGPAFGPYQMERATCDDLWDRYLPRHPDLLKVVQAMLGEWPDRILSLHGNHYYATAMCRIKYLTVKEALPGARDKRGLAQYWKQYYNTEKGKGTVEEFLDNYERWERFS